MELPGVSLPITQMPNVNVRYRGAKRKAFAKRRETGKE